VQKPLVEYRIPVGNGQFTTERVFGPETPKPETPPVKTAKAVKKASKTRKR
jgi:hypothetical protein